MFPSAAVTLVLGGVAITSIEKEILRNAASCSDLCTYIQNETCWTMGQFNAVQWSAIDAAFNDLMLLNKVRVLKFQHIWILTGTRMKKLFPSKSSCCFICTSNEENWEHLFHCSHELVYSAHTHMYAKLHADLMKSKTNCLIQSILIYKFQQWCGNKTTSLTVPNNELGNILQEALEEQNVLGWMNFAKGRFSSL
eukprot:4778421-Ditylum_brightwellii.AAC.1